MPRKYLKKKGAVRKGGRRLPTLAGVVGAGVAAGIANKFRKTRKSRKEAVVEAKATVIRGRRNFKNRMEQTDSIFNAPAVVIGTQRKLSFQEKVARTVRQPFLFKRNYQWSAECNSGRKAMFSIEVNPINTTDLLQDITTYKSALYTNTAAADPTISANSIADGAQFYVDKLIEKLSFVNSSSNALTGKIHLIAYKRDVGGNYSSSGAILQPINMAMYYSTNSVGLLTNGVGAEQTLGNGWTFDLASGGGLGWAGGYQMPGSSFNPTGVCMQCDPALSLFSPHIKDKMNFWFKTIRTTEISLRAGQQVNQTFVFNDLPVLHRELQEYSHVPGISFSIIVEFMGGIVGDSQITVGNGVISTGSTQISCIRTSQRTLGVKNLVRSNVVLQTAPLTAIALASQVIINPDTGIGLTGTVTDL